MYSLSNLFLVVIAVAVAQELNEYCSLSTTGKLGICKLADDCDEINQLTQQGKTAPLCGFRFNVIPIFCCTSDNVSVTPPPVIPSFITPSFVTPSFTPSFVTPQVTNDANPQFSYSEQKCIEYSKLTMKTIPVITLEVNPQVSNNSYNNCSLNSINLISSGTPALLKELPFMASLGYILNTSNETIWTCGGTLISENFVLTAAHCITNNHLTKPTVVRLGDLDLRDELDGSEYRDYGVAQEYIHDNYRPPANYHDIALLRLTSTVIFTDFIRPACLWTQPEIITSQVLIAGWGTTTYGGDLNYKLLKANIFVYNRSNCTSQYIHGDNSDYPNGITPELVCAGDLKSTRDTCSGDSGGPLLSAKTDDQCIQYVVGITSAGSGCDVLNSVAMYIRVSSYIRWIEKVVWNV